MRTQFKKPPPRRPAAWIRAEMMGHDWDGEFLSIYYRPAHIVSLLGTGGMGAVRGSWAAAVATGMGALLGGLVGWGLTTFSHAPATTSAGFIRISNAFLR